MRVTILDIEPIEPAGGGSWLRLKGLYHALGPGIEATYIGAFHWRGPKFRRLHHAPNFEEITVPFSDHHFAAAEALRESAGGSTVIDASFPRLGKLSEDYCLYARAAAAEADVVVFSHPWAYAVAGDMVRSDRQLLVYDAHNVEGVLRRHLLGGTPVGREIAEEAEKLEGELCHAADLVLACSHLDRTTLVQIYGIPAAKTRVCSNGVFARRIVPAAAVRRRMARVRLGLGGAPVALFIGGLYPPNVEAAEFICDRVAPACPKLTFVILGDAGDALIEKCSTEAIPGNLRITGRVNDAKKHVWLNAADLGINPMFSGSGTNIKMFDYLAAGLPVVTTPVGARGIEGEGAFAVADADKFAAQVTAIAARRSAAAELGRRGRSLVEREFDWANISAELGAMLINRSRDKHRPVPFFSVTIPTLDRPDKLRRVFDLLAVQRERDFEVITVDQSAEAFVGTDFGIDLKLLRSPVRGAARARNLAATVARGRVLVFIDDDCEPCDTWLAEAGAPFQRPDVVGLEGRVVSDRMHDHRWRSVHNYGAEGLGFMTCNLFVRAETFHMLGGFDVAFDEHDFRYDTDLLGEVPFSETAFVYHPPWPRTIQRESEATRDLLFEGDALLLRKHPERYRELFHREEHWRKGRRFWRPFLRGTRKHGVELPDYIRKTLAQSGKRERGAGRE